MKKLLTTLLTLTLTAATTVSASNPFADTQNHWAAEYISTAYTHNIISGVGGGLFDPDAHFTVAQAITVAARIHMLYSYGAITPHDAVQPMPGDDGHWAASSAEYLRQRNLTGHQLDFRLDSPVTRAEAMWIWSGIVPGTGLGALPAGTSPGAGLGANPGETLTRAEATAIFVPLLHGGAVLPPEIPAEVPSAELQPGPDFAFSDDIMVLDVAGTGTSGFSDGAAEAASFVLPFSITAAPDGGLIIFDTFNNAIRTYQDGIVETLTGERTADSVLGFPLGGYRNGPAAEALFNRPADGVFIGDALFVADSANHVIRRIADGTVTTFAGEPEPGFADGTGSAARFNTPLAIAADAHGNLYVADTLNNAIRRITTDGTVTTLAIDAELNQPAGITVTDYGVVVLADTGNHLIHYIWTEYPSYRTSHISTFGRTAELDEDGDPLGGYRDGTPEEAMFNLPRGLVFADNMLFVADSGNNVIRVIIEVTQPGMVMTAAGTGEPGDAAGPFSSAEFNQPFGLTYRDGVLYIADTSNNLIKNMRLIWMGEGEF